MMAKKNNKDKKQKTKKQKDTTETEDSEPEPIELLLIFKGESVVLFSPFCSFPESSTDSLFFSILVTGCFGLVLLNHSISTIHNLN